MSLDEFMLYVRCTSFDKKNVFRTFTPTTSTPFPYSIPILTPFSSKKHGRNGSSGRKPESNNDDSVTLCVDQNLRFFREYLQSFIYHQLQTVVNQ